MTATPETIREKLHQFIEVAADKKVQAIYNLFEEEIIDMENYNTDIEEAEKEIEDGNFLTHQQVLAEIKTWKSKQYDRNNFGKKSSKRYSKIYKYIEEDSPQNAEIIIDELVEMVSVLPENPERNKADEYKKNNTGNYRAFEHKKIRVSYKIKRNSIEIVRVRHTKQKPSIY